MQIRPLLETDAEEWYRLRRESLINAPDAFGKALEEHEAMPIEEAERRFREVTAHSVYLGAFGCDTLIGMATFLRDNGLKERHKGHIHGVYVTPDRRGNGVARALIARLIEQARTDASLEQILLSVAIGQLAAKRLYLSFGFQRRAWARCTG